MTNTANTQSLFSPLALCDGKRPWRLSGPVSGGKVKPLLISTARKLSQALERNVCALIDEVMSQRMDFLLNQAHESPIRIWNFRWLMTETGIR